MIFKLFNLFNCFLVSRHFLHNGVSVVETDDQFFGFSLI